MTSPSTKSHHCPPDRWPGRITAPVIPPTRVPSYKCGEAWSVHVRHRPTNQSVLINGSAGASPGALVGVQADVVYLGVAQLIRQRADYINDYWQQAVLSVGARRVVLVHWDDFTQPLDSIAPVSVSRGLPWAPPSEITSGRLVSSFRAIGDSHSTRSANGDYPDPYPSLSFEQRTPTVPGQPTTLDIPTPPGLVITKNAASRRWAVGGPAARCVGVDRRTGPNISDAVASPVRRGGPWGR